MLVQDLYLSGGGCQGLRFSASLHVGLGGRRPRGGVQGGGGQEVFADGGGGGQDLQQRPFPGLVYVALEHVGEPTAHGVRTVPTQVARRGQAGFLGGVDQVRQMFFSVEDPGLGDSDLAVALHFPGGGGADRPPGCVHGGRGVGPVAELRLGLQRRDGLIDADLSARGLRSRDPVRHVPLDRLAATLPIPRPARDPGLRQQAGDPGFQTSPPHLVGACQRLTR